MNLEREILGWQAWLRDRLQPDTAAHYLAHVRTLMPDDRPFWRSGLTGPAVARWLATRTGLVQKRRVNRGRLTPAVVSRTATGERLDESSKFAAVQSFATYLFEVGRPGHEPRSRRARPRRRPAPRCLFLELPNAPAAGRGSAQAVPSHLRARRWGRAGGQRHPSRSWSRTSILAPRQVRARGTKAWTRDRAARVADWAWPVVEAHLATVMPGERVFRGLDRWQASDLHRERLRASA